MGLTTRKSPEAVEVENKEPSPAWWRHGHLVAGVVMAVLAMFAVTALQFRSTDTRQAAGSVLALAFDVNDALASEAAPEAIAALHMKLLAAIEDGPIAADIERWRTTLAESGTSAFSGDVAATDTYVAALREVYGAVDHHARLSVVRIQQIQMGVVAAAAIILILLIRSVAARRQPEIKSRRARAKHPAQIDPLTGLGRIDTVRQRLAEHLETSKPGAGFIGLLVVGVQPEHEHFLPLTRAHLDASLLETTRRLRDTVRATDTIARLARDELAVVLPSSHRVEDPGRVASKVLGALEGAIELADVRILPNPRVGIAIAPLDAVTPDGLIQRARLARRAASDAPAAVYRSYSDDLAPRELGPLEMAEDLRAALSLGDGQLWVAYQPKIDLTSERVVGFEALARWDHPRLGSISPAKFIRVAEESDLILELGAWVLDQVCAQLATWHDLPHDPMPVSVNVSSRQFQDPSLAAIIEETLTKHGIPARLLELELTEGILLEDRQEVIAMMNDLSDLGVTIAVDDFGTGYSALSYLKHFPIDVLKIDRSFIRDLHDDDGDEAISTAIISMAHSLALQVVAEGVETPEQLNVLRTLGCDAAQGYYFAHPAPPAEIVHRAAV